MGYSSPVKATRGHFSAEKTAAPEIGNFILSAQKPNMKDFSPSNICENTAFELSQD